MKNIIVTPGITDLNRGDQALIWLIDDLVNDGDQEKYELVLLHSGNSKEDVKLQSKQSIERGYKVEKPILLHPGYGKSNIGVNYNFITKISWGLRGVKDLITSSMLLSKINIINKFGMKFLDEEQLKTLEKFKNTDMVVVKGGGFLHTYNRLSDLYYLYYGLYNLLIANRFKKQVVIMPNSYGPFEGKFEKFFVKKVLNKSSVVYARESISLGYINKILEKPAKLAPDLGFFIKSENDFELKIPNNKKTVAITMRPYRFPEYENPEKRYDNYLKEMAISIKKLIEMNFYPILVAHTLGPSEHEDDRLALKAVINILKEEGVEESNYFYHEDTSLDCFSITDLYNKVDYIIGTRFHSVIFAMTSLVPAIAISYSGHKTVGIMNDMGLEDYVVDIGNFDSNSLLNKFNQLVQNETSIKNSIKLYLLKSEEDKKELKETVVSILEKRKEV